MKYRDIVLSQSEIDRCVKWSEDKQAYKREREVVDQWYDTRSTSPAVDLMGRLGEVAACNALDLDWAVALDWEIRAGGDSGVDLLAYGYKWDVKTSTLNELIFNSPAHFKSDVALLVQMIGNRQKPESPETVWRIWGMCSKAKFLKQCVEHVYGEADHKRVRVKVGNDKLTSIEDFFNHITRKIWDDGEIS